LLESSHDNLGVNLYLIFI